MEPYRPQRGSAATESKPLKLPGSRPLYILAGLVLAAVVGIAVLGIDVIRKVEWRVKTERAAPVIISTPPATRFTEFEDAPSLLQPRDFGERRRFMKPVPIAPPFLPADARTFTNDDYRIAVGGVEGPPPLAVCEGEEKELWACGLESRSAIYNLIRGSHVFCEPYDGYGSREQLLRAAIPARCSVRGLDLAIEMVRTGYVRPAGLADRALIDAMEEAKAAKRGLWRGNWRILQR